MTGSNEYVMRMLLKHSLTTDTYTYTIQGVWKWVSAFAMLRLNIYIWQVLQSVYLILLTHDNSKWNQNTQEIETFDVSKCIRNTLVDHIIIGVCNSENILNHCTIPC